MRIVKRNDLYTISKARELLGVSKNKMWRLVRDGTIEVFANPLDKREKLFRSVDVEELVRYAKVSPEK